jgi:hypothetical protein
LIGGAYKETGILPEKVGSSLKVQRRVSLQPRTWTKKRQKKLSNEFVDPVPESGAQTMCWNEAKAVRGLAHFAARSIEIISIYYTPYTTYQTDTVGMGTHTASRILLPPANTQ